MIISAFGVVLLPASILALAPQVTTTHSGIDATTAAFKAWARLLRKSVGWAVATAYHSTLLFGVGRGGCPRKRYV